jgi:hypothetical protein
VAQELEENPFGVTEVFTAPDAVVEYVFSLTVFRCFMAVSDYADLQHQYSTNPSIVSYSSTV